MRVKSYYICLISGGAGAREIRIQRKDRQGRRGRSEGIRARFARSAMFLLCDLCALGGPCPISGCRRGPSSPAAVNGRWVPDLYARSRLGSPAQFAISCLRATAQIQHGDRTEGHGGPQESVLGDACRELTEQLIGWFAAILPAHEVQLHTYLQMSGDPHRPDPQFQCSPSDRGNPALHPVAADRGTAPTPVAHRGPPFCLRVEFAQSLQARDRGLALSCGTLIGPVDAQPANRRVGRLAHLAGQCPEEKVR